MHLPSIDRIRSRRLPLAFGLSLLLGSPTLLHAEIPDWGYCAPEFLPRAGFSAPQFMVGTVMGEVQFSAEQAEVEGDIYHLQGAVESRRQGQEVMADSVDYDAANGTAFAQGNVRYQDFGRVLMSESAEFDLNANQGRLAPAQVWLSARHLRGDADEINLLNPNLTHLGGARFTTCQTGNDDWTLQASRIELDNEAGEGEAYNAWISFMSVPIFYTPYLSFPLNDHRKSGFLVPSLGGDDESGTELTVPYYWNIAPDRDATIVPHFMSQRGILWETEFRYLNERSQGQLDIAYLPDDRVYGDNRKALGFQHTGSPADRWSTRVNYRYASDDDYLDDFNADLGSSSTTHLEQLAEVGYRSTHWQSTLRVQNFQTLDESIADTSKPYKRLPQLLLSTREFQAENGLTFGTSSEWVKFTRDAGVIGSRLNVTPKLSWPQRGAAGFFIPSLSYRYTRYDLDRDSEASDATPTRQLPIFSMNSGLVFERDLSENTARITRAAQQTLEPRLYYLYAPYRDQEDLILDEGDASRVFDTSLPTFGYNQLFRENRFNGADRIGDANQLSAAVTTRFLDTGGRELMSASLGRILYFQDREVTLPGAAPETTSLSNWVGELSTEWFSGFSSRASLQWDTEENRAESGSLDMRYFQDSRRVLHLNYRFIHETQKLLDLAGIWPITPQWSLVGRRLHSIHDDVTLDVLLGLEYESCCWSLRILNRRHRADALDEEASNSIWLQLELKGLTSVGRRIEDALKNDILAP